jgi:hypothetical protein
VHDRIFTRTFGEHDLLLVEDRPGVLIDLTATVWRSRGNSERRGNLIIVEMKLLVIFEILQNISVRVRRFRQRHDVIR